MPHDMKRRWRVWRPTRPGSARVQMESELTRVQRALTNSEGVQLKAKSELDPVQQALATAREACRKAEEEICRLTEERLSLIKELGPVRRNLSKGNCGKESIGERI